ncbi:7544_t:CDS:2, partial [Entrophospora sp. SA101]
NNNDSLFKNQKDKKENESIEAENIPIVVDNEVLESLMKEMIVGSVKYMIGSFDVEKALVEWKEKKERPCNDLAYYDILDITPGSNDMIRISDFKRAVNEYFILTREDSSKKYLWDYSYLLLNSIERDNELLKDSLSERHYRESFFTTMMSSLFHDYTQDMATF